MAQYGYMYRGYSGNDGDQPQEWRNTSYTRNSYPDQTYKPVLVDASESVASPRYVRKEEAYVQEVQGTVFMKTEPPSDYGVAKGRWGGHVYDSPQKVDEFPTEVRSEASRLTRPTPPSNTRNYHQAPNSTFEDHGSNQWSSSKNADDRKVGDLITKVTNWRLPSDSVCRDGVCSYSPKEDRGSIVLDMSDSKKHRYDQREDSSPVKNPSGAQLYGGDEVFKGNQPSYPSGQRYGDNEVFKGIQLSYSSGAQLYGGDEVFKGNQPSYPSGQRYGDNEVFKGIQLSYSSGAQLYGGDEVFKGNQPSYPSGQRYGDNEVFKGNQPSYPNGGKSTNTYFDYNDGESDMANAAPMAPQLRFTGPRRNAMRVAISSDEAQRSYGSLDPSLRAYQEGDDYLSGKSRTRQNNRGTIDSTEAVFKYNGEVIP
ncbi:hypothetical protein Nepgr_001484 [Nepenthes gracilis]|uniref:Uncharacterized protein n=1 Tax=Nepenthes gracilis TaxID=150966 RepID=A0AAD3RXS2_NEPGR|nr:hypothetical protein Nepgr_001484 [Nepenthes gracilis]